MPSVRFGPALPARLVVLLALLRQPALAVAAAAHEDAAPDAGSRPRYELYLAPTLEGESGARDVASAVTAMGAGEERLFGEAGGAGGVLLRSLRTIAWDAPLAWWFGVALHEGFGHGGRAREVNAAPGIHLGSPWERRTSYSTFDGTGRSSEELLYIYVGGTEANTLAGTLLERRAVEGVRLRPLDLWFLASNRFVASNYVLRTTPNPRTRPAAFFSEYSGGGDVANYLALLRALHGQGTGITPQGADGSLVRQYRRLRRQAIWNSLDPGAWWAVASALRSIPRGDAASPLPLPRAGRFRFLPILSSEWTPSGGETSLEWVMAPAALAGGGAAVTDAGAVADGGRRPPSWFSFVARRGRGPSGSFGALGAATAEALPAGPFLLGGMAEIWHDPRNGPGGGARLRARLRRGAPRGLYFDLGLKSQGYWVGQPGSPGPFAACGVLFGG